MADLFEQLKEQRTREEILADYAQVHTLREDEKYWYEQSVRQEKVQQLTLEVLLDIRDRLAEMREWLPSE